VRAPPGAALRAPAGALLRGAPGRAHLGIAHAATAAIAAAEQLHLGGHDVHRVALDAVLVGVLAVLQPALDVDRAALLQVLAGDLGQAVVEGDAVPLRVLDGLAGGLVLALGLDVAMLDVGRWPRRWGHSALRDRGRSCRRG
jgi:hypothetical protein